MKTWVTAEIFNEADQKMLIQPTPEFDGIEFYTSKEDGGYKTGAFYIKPNELRVIIENLEKMMNYVTRKE